jgi:hypothetical protein
MLFHAIVPNPITEKTPAFQLTTGIPLGGVYSGNGVVNGWFYPSVAKNGLHLISYTYTDPYGCSNVAMQTITVSSITGIEDTTKSDVQIFPNPVGVNLNVNGIMGFDYLDVVDVYGRTLVSKTISDEKIEIDVSHLSQGIYFVCLWGKDPQSIKFVKH